MPDKTAILYSIARCIHCVVLLLPLASSRLFVHRFGAGAFGSLDAKHMSKYKRFNLVNQPFFCPIELE